MQKHQVLIKKKGGRGRKELTEGNGKLLLEEELSAKTGRGVGFSLFAILRKPSYKKKVQQASPILI